MNGFVWDSEDQRKGAMALESWKREKGVSEDVRATDLFFIQKDQDSHEYWIELMGNQIKDLQLQIFNLSGEVMKLTKLLEKLGHGRIDR